MKAYSACREFILLEDLYWFLPEEKAKAALAVLDVDADGKVSMTDMRDAVVAIYKERKNLAFTLKVNTLLLAQGMKRLCFTHYI